MQTTECCSSQKKKNNFVHCHVDMRNKVKLTIFIVAQFLGGIYWAEMTTLMTAHHKFTLKAKQMSDKDQTNLMARPAALMLCFWFAVVIIY